MLGKERRRAVETQGFNSVLHVGRVGASRLRGMLGARCMGRNPLLGTLLPRYLPPLYLSWVPRG